MRNLILRSAGLCCASFLSLALVGCSGADPAEADEAAPALTAEAQAELRRGQVPPSGADGDSEARRSGRADGAPRRGGRPGRGGQGHGGDDGEACGGSGGTAGGASCEAGGQIFPDGSEVPSGDSCNTCSCGNGSVNCTRIGCEEVVCALFIEESDGVCSRFPLDPCKSQDPDCVIDG